MDAALVYYCSYTIYQRLAYIAAHMLRNSYHELRARRCCCCCRCRAGIGHAPVNWRRWNSGFQVYELRAHAYEWAADGATQRPLDGPMPEIERLPVIDAFRSLLDDTGQSSLGGFMRMLHRFSSRNRDTKGHMQLLQIYLTVSIINSVKLITVKVNAS